MPPATRSACLTKLNASGGLLWTRAYQLGDITRGIVVRRATDDPDQYVMAGHTESLSYGDGAVFVMRTDGLGNPIWCNSYGAGAPLDYLGKIEMKAVSSGGYIVSGSVLDPVVGFHGFLLRIDAAGNMIWMRHYSRAGGYDATQFKGVIETSTGFAVTGHAKSQFPPGPSENELDTIVLTVDFSGNPIWGMQYANLDGTNSGESLTIHGEGYAIVGGHLPLLLDNQMTELFKIDSAGSLIWYRRIHETIESGSQYDNGVANGTLRDVGGDLVFVGEHYRDATLLRFDAAGTFVAAEQYGQVQLQYGTSVLAESSGRFTFCGPSLVNLSQDYYVVRTNSNFLSGCDELAYTPPIDTPPVTPIVIDFATQQLDSWLPLTPVDVPLTWTQRVICQSGICVEPVPILCTAVDVEVLITWDPVGTGDDVTLEIWRDGEYLATADGDSFVDIDPPVGAVDYELHVASPDGTCEPSVSSCQVTVGDSSLVATVSDAIVVPWHPVFDPTTVCVADTLAGLGRNPALLGIDAITPGLGSADPSHAPIVWLSLGAFPAQHELTPNEGQRLADYLTGGGALYIEGSDVAFGPPTALSDLDGAIAIDDGAVFGELSSLIGVDSGVGFDASTLSADYTGSAHSIDHLAPEGPAAGPIFQNGGDAGQTTAIYFDAQSTGLGSQRVITSSTLLSGYAGDLAGLITAFTSALSPDATPGPLFIRGECNGDGSYDIGDGIFTLSLLFGGGPEGPCAAACDANADGGLDIGDAVFTLSYLLLDGAAPAAPFPTCGTDAESVAIFGCGTPLCQ